MNPRDLPSPAQDAAAYTWIDGQSQTEPEASQPLDPYLRWARTTDFRGYRTAADGEIEWLSFIARLVTTESTKIEELLAGIIQYDWLHIPPIYLSPVKGTAAIRRYLTGAVHKDYLPLLLSMSAIECLELGLPVATPFARTTPPGSSAMGDAKTESPEGEAAGKVIGIIDYGGPFLHPAFREMQIGAKGQLVTTDQTRFFSVWDQGAALGGTAWHIPEGFVYGREMSRAKINGLINGMINADISPMQVYADQKYTLDRDDTTKKRVLRDTHGAHVCDMLTGNADPLESVRVARGLPRNVRPGYLDDAARAPIIFVQIPLPTLVDSSGGSLNVHVLDGIRYIIDRSAANANIVINISYGQNGGPHDGSTLLEQAMDDLVEATGERLLLVVGAGNSRQDRTHAMLNVSAGAPEVLSWRVPVNDSTDSFLEVWYPDTMEKGTTDLLIEVKPPGGPWSPAVPADRKCAALCQAGDPLRIAAQLTHSRKVPNGLGPMALLALTPTKLGASTAPGTTPAPPGIWQIRLSTQMLGYSIPVHAWIEREDLPDSLARSEFLSHVSDACTVNGIATARHCIAVGGIRASDKQPVSYSGLGPTRDPARQGLCPAVLAECEESEALYGIRAGTMMPGNSLRMGGTSVAAPAAARRIFNSMAVARSQRARSQTTAKTAAQTMITAANRILRDARGQSPINQSRPPRRPRRSASRRSPGAVPPT
jgi:hypothetical protein